MGLNDCDDGKQYSTPHGYKLQLCFGDSDNKQRSMVNEIFKKNGICETGVRSQCNSQIFADEYRLQKKWWGGKKGEDWVVCNNSWCQGATQIDKDKTSRLTLTKAGDKINISG